MSRPVLAALLLAVGAGACSAGSTSITPVALGCQVAPASVVVELQGRLTAPGVLTDAYETHAGTAAGPVFVSARLRRPHGVTGAENVLTWAVVGAGSADVVSVDALARSESSWPHARFDVRAAGAEQSRACSVLHPVAAAASR
ncbi:MAG: hypothetical protein ACYDB7_02145 [Mycobacteriales bacterium]